MNDVSAALEACQRPGAATQGPAPGLPRRLLVGASAAALLGTVLLLVLLFALLGSSNRPTDPVARTNPATDSAKQAGPGLVDQGTPQAINLMPLIDLRQDVLRGKWVWIESALITTDTCGLQLPYQPPDEYDFRIEFARLNGETSVDQVLSHSGRNWKFALWRDLCGFEMIARRPFLNAPGLRECKLENGRRYVAEVQVRNDGVKALVNGEVMCKLPVNYQEVTLAIEQVMRDPRCLGLSSLYRGSAAYYRVEVVEISGPGTFGRPEDPAAQAAAKLQKKKPVAVPPDSAVDDPARWRNAINLMPLIDPARDGSSGKWKKNDFGLVSDNTTPAKLVIPYQPAEEYDFRIVFTRQEGDHSVCQVLSKGGRCFAWEMGLFPNKACGFNTVGGRGGNTNITTVPGKDLTNGKRHTSIVQVRNTAVSAYLDGVLIKEHRTDYRDMGEPYPWRWPTSTCLGLGSWNSPTSFHTIEVLEVTGKGTLTQREGPPRR
jgi:hypothetical protein